MTRYVFIPNDYAKEQFHLSAAKYSSTAITPLLVSVLGGEKNYDRSETICNPDDRKISPVSIVANADELENRILKGETITPEMMQRKEIGTIKAVRFGF